MKPITIFSLLFLLFSVSSCNVIADIFKAGFWVGIIAVILIVMIVLFLLRKMRR
jgi:hypothetical protein